MLKGLSYLSFEFFVICNINRWSVTDSIASDTGVGLWNLSLLNFKVKICTARNHTCDVYPFYKRYC